MPRIMKTVNIKLTPRQALVLFNIIDGAADAGACDDGLYPDEARALQQVQDKLLAQHTLWKSVSYRKEFRKGK